MSQGPGVLFQHQTPGGMEGKACTGGLPRGIVGTGTTRRSHAFLLAWHLLRRMMRCSPQATACAALCAPPGLYLPPELCRYRNHGIARPLVPRSHTGYSGIILMRAQERICPPTPWHWAQRETRIPASFQRKGMARSKGQRGSSLCCIEVLLYFCFSFSDE